MWFAVGDVIVTNTAINWRIWWEYTVSLCESVFNEYDVYDEHEKECESLDIEVMECFLIVGLSLNIAYACKSKQVKCIPLTI